MLLLSAADMFLKRLHFGAAQQRKFKKQNKWKQYFHLLMVSLPCF